MINLSIQLVFFYLIVVMLNQLYIIFIDGFKEQQLMSVDLVSNVQMMPLEVSSDEMYSLQKSVKIYLRRPDKSTYISRAQNKMQGRDLFKLTTYKTNITRSNLCLVLKGQKIENNQKCLSMEYIINQLDILHVHNLQNLNKKIINIKLKPFQCGLSNQQIPFTVLCDQNIKEAFQKCQWFNQQLSFIYSGRKLDLSKTFKDQLIQNQSFIVITTFSLNINIQEEKKQIPQKNDQFACQQEILMKPRSAEYEDIKKVSSAPKSLRKSVTLGNNFDSNQFRLSFKKKQKPSVYKSMTHNQSQQVIWQSGSSGDLKNSWRKQIRGKRHRINSHQKQIRQITEKSSSQKQNKSQFDIDCMIQSDEQNQEQKNQLSTRQRLELHNQMFKLLSSDNYQTKPQVTKLQPPQMSTDDFLQQSQQIQMKSSEQDEDIQDEYQYDEDLMQNQQSKQIKQPAKVQEKSIRSSLDLRQSIGKSRGQYVAPMIPTRDFDSQDDQQDEQFDC